MNDLLETITPNPIMSVVKVRLSPKDGAVNVDFQDL